MKARLLLVVILVMTMPSCAGMKWTAAQIDSESNAALNIFRRDINGADSLLSRSAGYLVFPRVIKAGVGVGGETGEGVLRVNGRSVGYYRTTSGSIGFQAGAQAKSVVIAFLTKDALDQFRNSSGWKVGVDGSVALIDVGAGKSVDTASLKNPIVGFVFNPKGLMYNLTFEGTKITQLTK